MGRGCWFPRAWGWLGHPSPASFVTRATMDIDAQGLPAREQRGRPEPHRSFPNCATRVYFTVAVRANLGNGLAVITYSHQLRRTYSHWDRRQGRTVCLELCSNIGKDCRWRQKRTTSQSECLNRTISFTCPVSTQRKPAVPSTARQNCPRCLPRYLLRYAPVRGRRTRPPVSQSPRKVGPDRASGSGSSGPSSGCLEERS